MATSQPTTDVGLPKTTVFQTTDRPSIHEHAEERWEERVLSERDDIDGEIVAWREATSVPYKRNSSHYLRYHVESDTLLLVQRWHNGRQAVAELRTVLLREWYEDRPGIKRAVRAIRRERGLQ